MNNAAALAAAAAVRPAANAMLQAQPAADVATAARLRNGAALDFRARFPGATIEFAPGTLAPENVLSDAGPLTAPSSAPSLDIAKGFLKSERKLYGLTDADIDGLEFIGESSSPTGLRMLRVRQVVNGRPVFLSETRILLSADGRVLRTLGAMVPAVAATVEPDSEFISASSALVTAMGSVGVTLEPAQIHEPAVPGAQRGVGAIFVDNTSIRGEVRSELVYFPLLPGTVIPAWQQVTFTQDAGSFTTIVDAVSGTLLWRKNIQSHASTQNARFSVYVQADGVTPASPAPHAPTTQLPGAATQYPAIARSIVSMFTAQNLTASQNGWITDGLTTTTGNNVDAYLDAAAPDGPDPGALDNNGRPIGNPDVSALNRDFLGSTPRDFGYSPAPLGANPDAGDAPTLTAYRRGVVTNLFYLSNWYHDKLYLLGFNEAAGNYQTNNFGNGGVQGDPVLAEVQDSSGTNNANFATPPDGTSGRMQMYIFTGPTPDRDGSLDPDIVLHELTHGLSNRLIGNGNGLLWDPGGGMGEGWSDFYALSLTNTTNASDPNGEYGAAAYSTYKLGGLTDNYLYGIRRFPYSTVNTVNPLTWADVDDITYSESGGITSNPLNFGGNGAGEVHNIGEIWANTLWEVRSRVIAANAADVPTGNGKMLQIVTDALKMTPANPSYIQARNAIISADCATNACVNEDSIWGGFADRGLGYGAIAPLGKSGALGINAYTGIKESFLLPHIDFQSVAIDDSIGNSNGHIDPGEPVKLTVTLVNPWRNTGKNITSAVAVLSSATPGVTITTPSSSYGAISAQGTLAGTPFQISVSGAALCGQSLDFTLAITSQPGSVVTSATFKIRIGSASGTDAPITYTRTIPGGLPIPDNNLHGVTDVQAISDDYDISNIKFRVDNLVHTWVGDLALGLKGPSGYGATMIYHLSTVSGGMVNFGANSGHNFVSTVIDDASTSDLDIAGIAAAPFTGTWATAFNSPLYSLFGSAYSPDAVGQLSRFNGSSAKGNWTVIASDWAAGDAGTLNSWSLIVTPTHFVCTPFVATGPVLTIAKTPDGATIAAGATATFTIVVTNTGIASATGVVITDTLPAGGGVTWVPGPGCSVSGAVGSQVLSCNAGTLAPTASFTGSVSALTSGGSCTAMNNTAMASASNASSVFDTGSITCVPLSSCTYAVSPPDLSNQPKTLGTPTITVTASAGCPVTATSFQPWVTIGPIVPGVGTTTVNLTIAANPGAARATSIVVAGRLYLITQLAGP